MAADYKLFIEDAQKVSKASGVPASVTLAQIILESSGKYENGLSGLAANHKNLFGVKGTGSNGSVSLPTKEVVNGQYITVNANFRSYKTYYDSILDHAKVLQNDRYTKHTSQAKTLEQYVQGIAKGGYATDPSYAAKLMNVIKTYKLDQYDKTPLGSKSGQSLNGPTMEHTHDNRSASSTGGSAGGSTAGASFEDRTGFTSQIFFHVTRIGAIVGIAILMIVFFLRAFPAVENVASAVPAAKVIKSVKKVRSVKKA